MQRSYSCPLEERPYTQSCANNVQFIVVFAHLVPADQYAGVDVCSGEVNHTRSLQLNVLGKWSLNTAGSRMYFTLLCYTLYWHQRVVWVK